MCTSLPVSYTGPCLKFCFSRYPDSGGAFKVQIYSPYLVVNKTGLPFGVKSARPNRAVAPQDVAGDANTSERKDLSRSMEN